MRITLADVRQSRLPRAIGLCAGDTPGISAAVNEAQQRLIDAGGETGWWNGWVKVVFPITVADPYITLPRQFSRIINMAVCNWPVRIHNEFYELLPDGIGLMPDPGLPCWAGVVAGYERGTFPTMVDLPGESYLRTYVTDTRDVGARMLITGLDTNGMQIYTQDVKDNTNGFYITFASPFADSLFPVTAIQYVQKDITFGEVYLYAVDVTTGVQTLLSKYGPTETNPSYRRYYITQTPPSCCPSSGTTSVAVTALAKLEYVPAYVDSDQLVITNIPALILECQAIRYEGMDVPNAAGMAAQYHKKAIAQLQNELRHYLGEQEPAVNVDRFGSAKLRRQSIGSLI